MMTIEQKQKKIDQIMRIVKYPSLSKYYYAFCISFLIALYCYRLYDVLIMAVIFCVCFALITLFLGQRKTDEQQIDQLLSDYEPENKKAFEELCKKTKEKNILDKVDLSEWCLVEKQALNKNKDNPNISFIES